MTPTLLVISGCVLHLLGGAMAWLGRDQLRSAAVPVIVLASICLGAAGILGLDGSASVILHAPWPVPGGDLAIGVDALSAVFLLPIAVLGGATAIYARGYWDAEPSGGRTRMAVAVLVAGMALVVTARHGMWFLLCWEAMALAAWVALSAEHEKREVRVAGWTYLIFTHLGTACLIAMVVLLGIRSGSMDWVPIAGSASSLDGAIVVLAILGFGAKAGLLPVHAWLPGAHASAPSHVSALLSGVMLKTGIYGILRITGMMPEPAVWWGVILVVVGAATALYGIASALTQTDYKRLLACSSIENLGIIATAVGLALMAAAQGRTDLAILACTAALLHVWHHAIFKGLLFLGAGSLLHATHTRSMDRLGGLLSRMPLTGGLCLIGCATAAGLPGLAGFASEWPLYCAGFADLRGGGWAGILIVIALALCGGLAVAAYTGLVGGVLLGASRSTDTAHAHDPVASMRGPMIGLALACVALPMAVPWTAAALAPAIGSVLHQPVTAVAIPGLSWLAAAGAVMLVGGGVLWWLLRRQMQRQPQASAGTWDCGYAAPTERMQYTVSSYTAILGHDVAPPPIKAPATIERATGLFPANARFGLTAGDGVLDRWIGPLADRFAKLCLHLRLFQQGYLHAYLFYMLVTVLVLLIGALCWGGNR